MWLFYGVFLLCDILLRPGPVRCEEYLCKWVQEEDVRTVIVVGVYFVKLG